ncbi:MAG: hypothetical protein JWM11_7816 [Planctomycetaceae bacterium]|nr:hypothetical protein [Planctomycetaceae bacterium]
MRLQTVGDLVEMVGSGRVDAIAIVRPRKNPQILRIRMRRGKNWDELWVQANAFDVAAGTNEMLQDALNTILDQVSPG